MTSNRNKNNLLFEETGLQDVIILVGIFIFTSILIIGLFPGDNTGVIISKELFVYAVMTVPIIAAIYFIIISFRRSIYEDDAQIGSSIRKKIALAFIFVAIMPSLFIVLLSNHLLNQTLSSLFFDRTGSALKDALTMAEESVHSIDSTINNECAILEGRISRGELSLNSPSARDRLVRDYRTRGYTLSFYSFSDGYPYNSVSPRDAAGDVSSIAEYLKIIPPPDPAVSARLMINGRDTLLGILKSGPIIMVLRDEIPDKTLGHQKLFTKSLEDYKELEYLRTLLRDSSGMVLLSISIIVIMVSVFLSLYLSKNITRPVLLLTDAAKKLAKGNFNIHLKRETEDELGLLFDSFNVMVNQLDQNRKTMYQKQKLEAWREMARKLVHEIKNPLTPIRLSAERMRKRYIESHPDIENIILTGTETIVEEVEVLMNILGEFTRFARLPEMKQDPADLKPVIQSCINVFSGHEKVLFVVNIDDELLTVNVDKVLFKQALTNLVQNAVDALGDSGEITISAGNIMKDEFRGVRITIADSGIGIHEKDLDRIFEPGFSLKSTGTGLGLAIVEKIILEHGGTITCRSEYGAGTEFTIELPAYGSMEGVYGADTDS